MPKLILAKALKKKKLSQRQFAKLMNTNYRNVYRMFRPGYNPRWSKLVKISKVIGLKIRDLYQD